MSHPEQKGEFDPSRRNFIAGAGTLAAFIALALLAKVAIYDHKRGNNGESAEKPPDKNAQFVPSIEIDEKIDAESFQKVVSELFEFVERNNIGQTIVAPDDPYKLENRAIVSKIDDRQHSIMLTKGLLTTPKLRTEQDSTAYNIQLDSISNFSDGEPSKTASFSQTQRPTLFYTKFDSESGKTIYESKTLSEFEMANFLKITIEIFNHRIDEEPFTPRDPSVEKGYL